MRDASSNVNGICAQEYIVLSDPTLALYMLCFYILLIRRADDPHPDRTSWQLQNSSRRSCFTYHQDWGAFSI
jgi:hypothetical protein